ncbi:catechol 2,3-dioxygenase-like lactoylglutathione lyase family enzyme [Saccharopolyspora lacisalsi]|uniref:Catechol 2,3-dioxygenase-like lactoylglutathione lyase family enzyme n=1 Tax=Halosaccharopolyspora lacisalsi TaxID=1000566 RepID=A0A839DSP2_9PSEU|nr:VOC family protein [Halosaccharopolyspora lacisalsi]MBA8824093.1 catechol 2,3-dioxygenase-like lactoylglutathione lyase family enzyme [Halosaccharopolyspora lacisalsi]
MKLRLHHVNVVSDDMPELHKFYSEVLGLETTPLPPMVEHLGHQNDRTESEDDDKWNQNVAFFDASGDDEMQIHAGRRQAYLGPRMGHAINPLLTGHFAFRTDDLDAVRKYLTEQGVPFSDYGEWAVKDWDQIFLTDPAGNVIEIHQIMS